MKEGLQQGLLLCLRSQLGELPDDLIEVMKKLESPALEELATEIPKFRSVEDLRAWLR
jgi:hypothetical protein